MAKYIIFFIISFALALFVNRIIELLKKRKHKKQLKKVKPLSKQNFKKAMKDLEIK